MAKLRKSKNKHLLKAATKFQGWDYEYQLNIEKQCMQKMLEYHKESNIIADNGNSKIAKQIKMAIKLLDIAVGKNSYYDVYSKRPRGYINKKNYRRFLKHEYSDPEFTPAMLDCLRQCKAWYLYNKIRYNYMFGWWD